ncbi:Ig-like domain-containing protein, partial [Candidatus Woesearchaeota archaeon]|nr:Ig-like domain-containing protein [Candidatus Woesearchaeota archaeon]
QTDYEGEGSYVFTITISDGYLNNSQEVEVTVLNLNRAPELLSIEDIIVNETELVIMAANASDPDNDSLTYSIDDPRFTQDGNVFTWTPENQDVGTYDIEITVSDGHSNDSGWFSVNVDSVSDLSVGNLYVVNSSPNEGEDVQVRFFIYNNGQTSQDVSYMIDTDSTDQNPEYTTSNVGAGSFRITWVSWVYDNAGSYSPAIIIDNNNNINEFDETNNELMFGINPININQIVIPPVIHDPIEKEKGEIRKIEPKKPKEPEPILIKDPVKKPKEEIKKEPINYKPILIRSIKDLEIKPILAKSIKLENKGNIGAKLIR